MLSLVVCVYESPPFRVLMPTTPSSLNPGDAWIAPTEVSSYEMRKQLTSYVCIIFRNSAEISPLIKAVRLRTDLEPDTAVPLSQSAAQIPLAHSECDLELVFGSMLHISH